VLKWLEENESECFSMKNNEGFVQPLYIYALSYQKQKIIRELLWNIQWQVSLVNNVREVALLLLLLSLCYIRTRIFFLAIVKLEKIFNLFMF